ncbi:hypothetical protein ACC754_43350, partial [Rhizobium johnstonii]
MANQLRRLVTFGLSNGLQAEADPSTDGGDGRADHGSALTVNGAAGGEDTQPDDEDETIKPLPDSLVLDLTAARTVALRN